jgi:glycosyltransferase involved in cell wall biosynthesis
MAGDAVALSEKMMPLPAAPARPEVSIVIPAFNARGSIATTLASVAAQTLAAIEILVIDDGSTDGTGELADSFAATDPRITVVRQPNAGVAVARNRGAERARGEFLAFCDADDWWDPSFLEKAVRVFRASSADTGAVFAWTAFHDDAGRPLPFRLNSGYEGDVSRGLLVRNFIGSGSATIFRRDIFARTGGYSPRFALENAQGCEDWELLLRIARIARFRVVPEFLIHYRRRTGGMSSRLATMCRSHELLLKLVLEYWPDVSARDLRLARRNFSLYLSDEAIRLGRVAAAWRWIWRAWRTDLPLGARCRTTYKFAGRTLLLSLGITPATDTGPQTADDV